MKRNVAAGRLNTVGEWKYAKVADLQSVGILLVEDGNHGENRPRQSEFVEDGPAFIRAADMDAGRVLFKTASKINEQAQNRIVKGIGLPRDVLLSHKGTVGKVAYVPHDAPDFVCSPQTTFWRSLDEKRLSSRYLYAFLRSPSFHVQLETRAGETDMAPYVSLTSQRGLFVQLPPIEEQREIARILGALDDKIEANRRMNETLEEMARSLFKSWFVDFDPVRAKSEGRDTGLPAHISDLFPDRFEDSELGEIPEGWSVKSLDEIAHFLNGAALQKYPPEGSEYLPVIKIAELRKGITEASGKASVALPQKFVVEDGDLLFSWSGSLEAQFWTGGRGALNQHLFKVTSDCYPSWLYYFWILRYLPEFRDIAADKATTMGHIKRQHLADAQTVVAPPEQLEAMGKLILPLQEKIIANDLETRTLATIRDALLPKLISGELRVSKAEQIVGGDSDG